jgi:putative oxidoreductase
MQPVHNFRIPSILLRMALAIPYLWFVADRLGLLGAHGQPHVGWGDWGHFMEYARQTMSFLPGSAIPFFAVLATIGESSFGLLLLTGCFTRVAAIGSGILSFLFACSMAISFGIESPLGYSVFTVSAASFLLACVPEYEWSVDQYLVRNQRGPAA